MKKLLITLLLFLFVAGIAAVGAENKPGKAEIGKKFIDFTAKTLDKDDWKFSEYIEGKSVALKFGATWCGWCVKLHPELEKIEDTWKDFVVVEVDLLNPQRGETEEKVREYAKQKKTTWPVILDNGQVASIYMQGGGVPQTVLIGPDGTVRAHIGGYRTFDAMKPTLEAVRNGDPLPGEVGSIFPDFELKDIDDKEFKLSTHLKKGPVVLKFGATWCGPCQKMVPVLNDLVDKYKSKVAVIEADLVDGQRDTVEKVKEHNKKLKPKYRVLLDEGTKVFGVLGANSIPVTIVLSKYGEIIARHDGVVDVEQLSKDIEKAMNAQKPKDKKKDKEKDKEEEKDKK
ncbi:MAG: hypothetical protein Kow00107_06590 [Planctomycetota bacterium]